MSENRVPRIKSSLLLLCLLCLFIHSGKAYANNLTTCGAITSPGVYTLQNDVTSTGTCFSISSNDVILDLNGHTITYDNAAPITVTNGSFESADMSAWDLSGASSAVRAAGTYNGSTVYRGDYALKIPAPLTQDQSAVTSSSYPLTANQPYSASVMLWQPYDVQNASNSDIHMFVEILNAADDTVLASKDSRTVQARYTTRGFQNVSVNYTPTSSINIKVRLRVTGGRTVVNTGQAPYGAFYFDDVRIQQTGSRGIAADVGWARRFHFTNGKIVQGQAHGDWSHAIASSGVVGTDNPSYEVDNLEITVSGANTKAFQALSIDNASIHNMLLHSMVDTIEIRDHYDGALIHIANGSTNGSISYVTIDSGIQTGIYARSSGATNRLQIHHNDITLQSKYTNDFGVVSYGNYGDDIYNNVIRCGSGNNTCRGIYLNGNGGTIHHNTIDVHYRAINQEYGGCSNGSLAAYGIQMEESTTGVEVYANSVTANADECGAIAFRYFGPANNTKNLNNYVHDNTFTALDVNGSTKLAATLSILETSSASLSFINNTLITNAMFLAFGQSNFAGLDRSFTMDGNTFQISYPKSSAYYPLADETYPDGVANAPRNVTISNNIYSDATVRTDMSNAQFRSYYLGYAVDPGAFNIVITEGSVVADTTAPTISLTTPSNNSTVNSTVALTVNDSDNVGVSRVEFYVNNALQSSDTVAPYSFNWNTTSVSNGSYTLSAKAYDAAGNVGQSANVSVTVNNPVPDTISPTVTLTSPASYATVGGTTTVSASANDNIGVARVDFMVNGVLRAAVNAMPYSFNWNTMADANGSYTISAKAYDAAGNVALSSAIIASVINLLADTVVPTVTAFAIPSTATSLTVAVSFFTASDAVGVNGYLITESATKPAASATGWSASVPTSFTFSAAGSKTAYAWAKDAAGNVSASRSAAVTITSPPVSAYTIADALLALRIAVGIVNPSQQDWILLDVAPLVNGKSVPNGLIDISDALTILTDVVGTRKVAL